MPSLRVHIRYCIALKKPQYWQNQSQICMQETGKPAVAQKAVQDVVRYISISVCNLRRPLKQALCKYKSTTFAQPYTFCITACSDFLPMLPSGSCETKYTTAEDLLKADVKPSEPQRNDIQPCREADAKVNTQDTMLFGAWSYAMGIEYALNHQAPIATHADHVNA